MNHEWTQIDTNTDEPPSTTTGAKMLLHFLSRWCDPVMGGSPPGSAGVPPAQILSQLRPSPSTGINRQRRPASASAGPMRFPPTGWSAATSPGKLSGNRRDSMRAGRPRSRGCRPDGEVGGIRAGDFSESRPVPFGKLPFACEPGPRPPQRGGSSESETGFVSGKSETGFVSGKSGPRPHDGAHHSEEKQPFVNEDEPPMNTNRHQD